MRIVVCVKQVYDPKTVRISRSREEFDLRDAAKITNPPDRYALEAALRLREAVGGEVLALTAGDETADDVVREAVAIGADHGVLVAGKELAAAAGSIVTRVLAAAIERLGGVDLVLTGQAGYMDGTGSLAPRLAAVLGWPVVLDAVRLVADSGGLTAHVVSDGAGLEVPFTAPAVVTVVSPPRLVQWGAGVPDIERPRYASPARIANAWNPGMVETWSLAELGLGDLTADTETGNLILGPERVRGQVIGGTIEDGARTVIGLLRAKRVIA